MMTWSPRGMALSSHGLLFTYRGEKERRRRRKKEGWRIPPKDFVAPGVSSLSDREEKILPLLFLKIDFKHSLLLITVQPQKWTEEGHSERSVAVIWSLRSENQTEKRNNLPPTASAHAIAITGTLTRTLDRQTKREKLCSVGVG